MLSDETTNESNASNDTADKEALRLKAWELKLKERELAFQENSLKLNHNLEKLKIVTTGIVATLVPSFISWVIQTQQVEIQRLSREQDYINSFSEQALQSDLQKRLTFADYLSTIAHSRSSRQRWKEYKVRIDKLIDLEKAKQLDIDKLREKIAILSEDPNENKDEIEELEKILADRESDLQKFQDAQILINAPFTFNYDLNAPIIEGGKFIWRDALVSELGKESIPESQVVIENIVDFAVALQEVEDFLGSPIKVKDWYRSPEVNRQIGGASRSKHLEGYAADIYVEGIPRQELYQKLDAWWGDRGGLSPSNESDDPEAIHIDMRSYFARWP